MALPIIAIARGRLRPGAVIGLLVLAFIVSCFQVRGGDTILCCRIPVVKSATRQLGN